jgi:hypothetical protein
MMNNILLQTKIYSVDDPYIYSIFSGKGKLIKSIRKNPKINIILYGRSLNLFCFIQGLINRRISTNQIKLIIPNIYTHAIVKDEKGAYKKDTNLKIELDFINTTSLEQTPELEDYIIELLKNLGVEVYRNYNFSGVTFTENNDMKYKFEEEGNIEKLVEFDPSIIVTGGLIDVDQDVFNFIHNNGLVYNGRMIIDKNFKTADNNIFAAGRLCEFSHLYEKVEKGKLLKLER